MTKAKRLAFSLMRTALVLAVFEMLSWAALKWVLPAQLETSRLVWSGQKAPDSQQYRCIGQPYLLIVPCPNWKDASGVQHNAEGFRGPSVPLARTPGVARVVCIGGSTTYGWGSPLPSQAYPAQMERLLNEEKPADWDRVEVINGGVIFGSTAEHLTHYALKWTYYKPDVLVLEAGGNDADAELSAGFQPDYSHWRQEMRRPERLGAPGRWIARSHLGGLLLALLIRGNEIADFTFKRRAPPTIPWYRKNATDGPNPAYRHNLEMICAMAAADGVKVLLVPFRSRPGNTFPPEMQAAIDRNEATMKEIARARNLPMAPMPGDAIRADGWWDTTCHLLPGGDLDKATHLVPYVRKLLDR